MPLFPRKHDHPRRQNRRVYTELSVGIAIHSRRIGFPPRRPQFHGTVQDASMAGLGILTERAIPVGAGVKLWICLTDHANETTLKLRGDVVWCEAGDLDRPCRAGIHLRDGPRKHVEHWVNLITEHMRRQDS